MYIALGQRLTTLWGRNFDVNRNILSFWSLVASLNKISFKSVFIHFFSWFYTYSPRAGADSPQGTKFWCQQKCLVTSFICLWSLILYNFFFSCFIHVYTSPGAGADSPKGTKFWCQQKGLITLPICCKFQISWKFDLIQYFYTPIIYAEGYIVFVFPFVRPFVCSLVRNSVPFVELLQSFMLQQFE